jgi:hypothetical protein
VAFTEKHYQQSDELGRVCEIFDLDPADYYGFVVVLVKREPRPGFALDISVQTDAPSAEHVAFVCRKLAQEISQ